VLYGFARDGAYRWKAEVPAPVNPFLAMMQDTAGLAAMMSSFGMDSSDIADARAEGFGRAGGRSGAAGDRAGARGGAGGGAGVGRAGAGARGGAARAGAGRGAGNAAGVAGRGGRAGVRGSAGSDAMDPFERLGSMSPAAASGISGTVLMLSDGELAVPDVMSRRTTIFDTTGAQVRSDGFFTLMDAPTQMSAVGSWIVGSTRSVMGMLSGMMGGGKDDSGYAIKVMPTTNAATSKEIAHMSIAAPMSFDGTTMKMNLSPPMPLLASSGDRLFVASNERYSIDMYDVDGQKIGTLGRTVKRKPVTAANRMRTTREFAQMMDSIPPMIRQQIKMEPVMSDSLPVINAMAAGDSMLLVRRGEFVSSDPPVAVNTSRWDVIGWDNSYKGYVDLPSGFAPARIHNGRLYGVLTVKAEKAAAVYTIAPPRSAR
jgi:hypothetical protein